MPALTPQYRDLEDDWLTLCQTCTDCWTNSGNILLYSESSIRITYSADFINRLAFDNVLNISLLSCKNLRDKQNKWIRGLVIDGEGGVGGGVAPCL